MASKLNFGRAWDDAVALVTGNLPVVLVVAGVFFFLPSLASTLLMPLPDALLNMDPAAQPNPEQLASVMGAWLAENWWVFVLSGLLQAIGVLGLLALLTDQNRPTVGEALAFGAKAVPTYVGTQLITAAGFGMALILVGLVGSASPVVAGLLILIMAVGFIYVSVKLLLVSPVIGIERQLNPLAVIARSWRLTKGNSLLIFGYMLLLGVAFVVISMVIGMVFGLFLLIGDTIGEIVNAIGNAVLSAALVVAVVAVMAAIYRQLAGPAPGQQGDTFA